MTIHRSLAGISIAVCLLVNGSSGDAAPLGTTFTYQGRLQDTGSPVTGPYDFKFALYDAPAGGSQIGVDVLKNDVEVTNGFFTTSLDFGAVFDGSARFLQIGIRPGSSVGAYVSLSARQELTPAPNALFSSITGDSSVQRRLTPPTCAAGEYIRSIAADGTPTCAADVDTSNPGTVTSITAGSGLSGGTITSSGTIAVSFGGSGSASSVSHRRHPGMDAASTAALRRRRRPHRAGVSLAKPHPPRGSGGGSATTTRASDSSRAAPAPRSTSRKRHWPPSCRMQASP